MTSLRLLLLTSLRHSTRHKVRTLLTLLGLIIGVSTFIFAPTLAASISTSIQDAIADLAGQAEIEIRGEDEGLLARTLSIVRRVPGIEVAAPLVQTVGVLPERSEPLAIFGVDFHVDRSIHIYRLAAGRWPRRSGEALLSAAYARERAVQLNQRLTLIASAGSSHFKIVGLLDSRGVGRLNNGDLIVIPYQEAQLLRGDDRLDAIAVTLSAGVDRAAVMQRLRKVLPASTRLEIPQAQRGSLQDIQGVLNFIMGFTSLMILSVGSSLVYNTLAVAAAQRRVEIGILRSLGVTQRSVRWIFLLESGLLGLIGTLVGIALGYGLVQIAGQTIDLSQVLNGTPTGNIMPVVPAWLPGAALIAGVGLPLLAGYLPARSAARVDPIEALSGTRPEVGFMRVNRRRVLQASVLLAASALGLLIYLKSDVPGTTAVPLLIAAQLLALPAVILLLPSLIAGLGRITPRLLLWLFGSVGLLAGETLTKRPKRTTATATILLVCLWAAVTTSSTNFGYQAFVDEWNASENIWDLTVSGAGSSPFKPLLSLPPNMVERIARRPEIAATVAERVTTLKTPEGDFELRAIDIARFRSQGARFLWDNGDEAAAYTRLTEAARPTILVSGFASLTRGLHVGDFLTLATPRGAQRFEIVGTVLGAIQPAQAGEASLIMDRNVYRRLWGDNRIDRLAIKLQPDRDAAAVRRDLQAAYAGSGLVVISPAELAATFKRAIDNMMIVSQLMSLLLLVTLMLGIANTLVIDVLDRRREMGLLRALGLLGYQVAAILVLEVIVLVAIVSVLAIPLGIYHTYANTLAMSRLFAVRFTLIPHEVIGLLLVVLFAAIVAAYVPARQAGQVDVIEALHHE
ncbi:Macrolide export ATP-binding/permease protein MacB [Thermoflexales bacterium]|nr:Macrolide export ATP-binding/permease protein MacB [Thermoflexales bacterium]